MIDIITSYDDEFYHIDAKSCLCVLKFHVEDGNWQWQMIKQFYSYSCEQRVYFLVESTSYSFLLSRIRLCSDEQSQLIIMEISYYLCSYDRPYTLPHRQALSWNTKLLHYLWHRRAKNARLLGKALYCLLYPTLDKRISWRCSIATSITLEQMETMSAETNSHTAVVRSFPLPPRYKYHSLSRASHNLSSGWLTLIPLEISTLSHDRIDAKCKSVILIFKCITNGSCALVDIVATIYWTPTYCLLHSRS